MTPPVTSNPRMRSRKNKIHSDRKLLSPAPQCWWRRHTNISACCSYLLYCAALHFREPLPAFTNGFPHLLPVFRIYSTSGFTAFAFGFLHLLQHLLSGFPHSFPGLAAIISECEAVTSGLSLPDFLHLLPGSGCACVGVAGDHSCSVAGYPIVAMGL
jgi:hypothetical protein